ncbi:MAG TPA: SRPBCC family protein, partial [Thermomicrobiales bacterium]|nr:SRPBCC family protein [Thermomicrobiales bacterium]
MAPIHVSAERVIPAPAPAVYALLADYKSGHPTILPSAFSDFRVLEGGIGAGTRIQYALTIGGRGRDVEAVIAEPEPGRVLTETTVEGGLVTTFTVDPIGGRSRLRFDTIWEPNRGLTGLI